MRVFCVGKIALLVCSEVVTREIAARSCGGSAGGGLVTGCGRGDRR